MSPEQSLSWPEGVLQFMVMSTPQAQHSADIRARQASFWDWLKTLEDSVTVRCCYVKAGRGVFVVFEVDSHETLHRLMNEWTDRVPATLTVWPLVDRGYQERRARGD